MATGRNEDTSDELFGFKCSSCVKINRHREAVSYCVECQGYCCQSCVDMHKLFPATEKHNLLDKSSFKASVLTTDLPEIPTERCSIHPVKILDMYCENHDVVGCTTCMALDHRSCTNVKSVPDVIDTIFQTSDVEKTYQDLQNKTAVMKEIKESRQNGLKDLLKSKAEALKAIKDFRKDMERLLEIQEKESIKEVENEFQKIENTLKEESKKAGDEEDDVQRMSRDLKSSEENRAQQFVLLKNAQKKIDDIAIITRSLAGPVYSKITFTANENMGNFIRGRKTLGEVRSHRTDSLSPKTTLYSVERSTEMNIKFKDNQSTCNVHDSCFTEDGMVLLADTGNGALKRVDPAKRIEVDQLILPSQPGSVCCPTKDEAAVSLDNNAVQFVSLGTRMTLTRKLKLDHKCFGIAHNDDKLFISDDGKSLYTYDMKGNLLQKISHDSITRCKNISYSDSSDRVFVCDWNKGLVTFEAQGKHVSTLSDTDLNAPHGVCTDKRGNIFVCGFGSHNVLQIAEDGKTKVGVVVKSSDGVYEPLSVCFDPQRCMLIVTQCVNDTIKLFDLK